MPGMLELSVKEATLLAGGIVRNGGNADGLMAAINDVKNPGNGRFSIPATTLSDEEWLEEKHAQCDVERGTDLECIMCHDKFGHLVCGTCEICFREWMIPLKPKERK